jgi:hypothetical protein
MRTDWSSRLFPVGLTDKAVLSGCPCDQKVQSGRPYSAYIKDSAPMHLRLCCKHVNNIAYPGCKMIHSDSRCRLTPCRGGYM